MFIVRYKKISETDGKLRDIVVDTKQEMIVAVKELLKSKIYRFEEIEEKRGGIENG